jgi:glucose-6-phosphate isomerase
MNAIDQNFELEKDYTKNIPLMMGLIGFYNTYVGNHASRAILPYC